MISVIDLSRIEEVNLENSEHEERVKALEAELSERDEALNLSAKTTGELKESRANLEKEIATLKQEKVTLEGKLATANDGLKEVIRAYRELILKSSPEVLPELVSGDSVASINESLEKARALVSRVKQNLESEILSVRVPAGAPVRKSPDFSGLSPREKISYAVSTLK